MHPLLSPETSTLLTLALYAAAGLCGLAGMIAIGFMIGAPGIRLRGVGIPIVISIGDIIQPVYRPSVCARTC